MLNLNMEASWARLIMQNKESLKLLVIIVNRSINVKVF